MIRPLDGVLVLDFTTLLPGPLAGLALAEAGARVVKIERPEGEDMRGFPPVVAGRSAAYDMLNAGKEVLRIDLKDRAARARLDPLLAEADVVLEQFRPGVMARLGLGPQQVRALNPGVIYCSISGFGQYGPRAGDAGHDITYQAVSGLLSLSPATPAALVADIAGGAMPAVTNILLALIRRAKTGKGATLDIAMTDAMFSFAWQALAARAAGGPAPETTILTGALPRYGLYATADCGWVAIGALEEKFWLRLCDAIDLPQELRDDARTPDATRAALRALIGARDRATWRTLLAPLDCSCAVVETLEEALADPHVIARGVVSAQVADPAGRWPNGLPVAPLPIAPIFRADFASQRQPPRDLD